MEQLLVVALTFGWIPHVVGLLRWVRRYWLIRNTSGAWLVLCILVALACLTPLIVYVSVASANRLLGFPPFEGSLVFVSFALILAYLSAPVLEVGYYLWQRGALPDPALPIADVKGNGHSDT